MNASEQWVANEAAARVTLTRAERRLLVALRRWKGERSILGLYRQSSQAERELIVTLRGVLRENTP